MQVNQGDSQLLVIGNQIGNLILDLYFGHNLCFKYPNGSCEPILYTYIKRTFQSYKEFFNPMSFDPWNHLLKIWKFIGILIPKVGAHLGSFFHIFSYIPRSMKCDS